MLGQPKPRPGDSRGVPAPASHGDECGGFKRIVQLLRRPSPSLLGTELKKKNMPLPREVSRSSNHIAVPHLSRPSSIETSSHHFQFAIADATTPAEVTSRTAELNIQSPPHPRARGRALISAPLPAASAAKTLVERHATGPRGGLVGHDPFDSLDGCVPDSTNVGKSSVAF
ncbi:hypothetical protein ACJZ2D_002718 [Fusarium nematophilum]